MIDSDTLSEIFRDSNIHLLTAEERVTNGTVDVVAGHLYKSLVFKLASYIWYLGMCVCLGYILYWGYYPFALYGILRWIGPGAAFVCLLLSCSKKLR